MTDRAKIDTRELDSLVDVLGRAPGAAAKDVRAVVAKGSLNIKRDAQRRISGSRHFPHVARAISYDVKQIGPTVIGEVGPEHGRSPQAALAWIPENGSLRTPPTPYMLPAGRAEEPRFIKALEDLGEKAIET